MSRNNLVSGGQILQQLRIMANLRRRSHQRNPPAVEHVGVAGDLQGQIEMLLDDHNRNFIGQYDKAFGNFFDHTDPNALRGLVEQK